MTSVLPGQTKSDLERLALPATVLRTSLSPTSPDKQSPTSNIRPCPPRSSAPVPPRHPRTNKVRPPTLGPARHGPPHQSLPDIPGQTKSDLEHSALPATVLLTSPSPTSPDKQSPTSNIRPCAPRSSAPVPSRHPRTNKVRPRTFGPARHGPPHQSLPDIPGQTKSDLEHLALPATVLRTNLSRHSRTNKVRPRTFGPARHGPPHQPLPDKTGQTKSALECSALRASLGPVFRIFPL